MKNFAKIASYELKLYIKGIPHQHIPGDSQMKKK